MKIYYFKKNIIFSVFTLWYLCSSFPIKQKNYLSNGFGVFSIVNAFLKEHYIKPPGCKTIG